MVIFVSVLSLAWATILAVQTKPIEHRVKKRQIVQSVNKTNFKIESGQDRNLKSRRLSATASEIKIVKESFNQTNANKKPKQSKRQSFYENEPSIASGRNEDPWFLDQPPYPPQPYRFGYNVKGVNGLTEQYRQEVGDGKLLTGSYGYLLPDGIYRHVDYVADERGFRAYIRTSEPGTANQNPSNVVIASTAPNPTSSSFITNDPIRSSVEYASDLARINAATNLIDAQLNAANQQPKAYLRNFTSFSYPPNSPLSTIDDIRSSSWPYDYQYPWSTQAWWLNRTLSTPPPSSVPSTGSSWNTGRNFLNSSQWLGSINTPPNKAIDFSGNIKTSSYPTTIPINPLEKSQQDANRFGRFLWTNSGLRKLNHSQRLEYDYPLTSRNYNSSLDAQNSKVPYDNTDQTLLNWLNFERAKHLEELRRQFHDRHHSIVTPLKASTFESNENLHISGHRENHSNQHHESHVSTFDPRTGRILHTKERVKGTKTGSASEYEIQSEPKGHSFGEKGGHLGQPYSGNLLAPYANHLQSLHQIQFDTKSSTSGPPSTLTNPTEPTTTVSIPNLEHNNLSKTSTTVQTSTSDTETSTTPTVAPQFDDRNGGGVKTTTVSNRFVRRPESLSDLRMSLAMQDVRSLRNTIGLPLPPRSSSPPKSIDHLKSVGDKAARLVDERLSQLDKLLAAHQQRQYHDQNQNQNSSSPTTNNQLVGSTNQTPQKDLHPVSSSLDNSRDSDTPGKLQHRLLSLKRLELSESSRRRPSAKTSRETLQSGPLMRISSTSKKLDYITGDHNNLAFNDINTDVNVTSESPRFDARRISKNLSKLQAEKVSELEKFQQRLKTQQLLLAQAAQAKQQQQQSQAQSGSQASNNEFSKPLNEYPQYSKPQKLKPPVAEVNSHVRYDDATENQILSPKDLRPPDSNPGSRSRRQNEYRNNTVSSDILDNKKLEPVASKLLSTVPIINIPNSSSNSSNETSSNSSNLMSDLAKKFQQWPAILGASEQVKPSKVDQGSESGKQPASAGSTGSSSKSDSNDHTNSINIDFINSVTALSMDQMNPFALTSVNPALRSGPNSFRLTSTQSEPGLAGVATTNARFSNSPSLLAALEYHERQGTSDRLSRLLDSQESPQKNSASVSSDYIPSHYPANHRFQISENSTAPESSNILESSSIRENRAVDTSKRFIEVVSSSRGGDNSLVITRRHLADSVDGGRSRIGTEYPFE